MKYKQVKPKPEHIPYRDHPEGSHLISANGSLWSRGVNGWDCILGNSKGSNANAPMGFVVEIVEIKYRMI